MALAETVGGQRPQVKIAVSTDCLGLLSNPRRLIDTWGFIRGSDYFEGVEAIAWRAFSKERTRQTVATLKDLNFGHISLHGGMGEPVKRNGALDGYFVHLVHSVMETNHDLVIKDFGVDSILFHAPVLK